MPREEQFSFNIGEDDLETFKKGECPANTTKSTEWAMKNFELWRIARNAKLRDQCPEQWFVRIKKTCVDGCVDLYLRHEKQTEVITLQEAYIYLFLAR